MNSNARKPNNLLRHQREKRGWSQRKVADQLDTTEDKVSRWERGERSPSPFYREKLCELFGVNAEELGFIEGSTQTINSSSPSQTPFITKNSLDVTHMLLSRYLQRQTNRMHDTLVTGSTNLQMKDVVGYNGLFISPPWEDLQGISGSTSLVEYLIDAMIRGKKILLLGDAGQGKTTLLKRIFILMADNFIEASPQSAPLPIYVPLREFTSLTGNIVEVLWTHIYEEFPLPFEDFTSLVRNNHIVFLLDGFDEIRGELTQRAINDRVGSKIFSYTSILSCRKSFFEFYLSMSTLQEQYSQSVELLPLSLTHSVTSYIEALCLQKQKKVAEKSITPPKKIIKAIQDSQELQDLARRPLLLIMIVDIFTDPKEMREGEWSVTKLYSKYTEKWLKNEAAKSNSVLKWNDKATLLQVVAWTTYMGQSPAPSPYNPNQNATFSYTDLAHIIKTLVDRYHVPENQLLDDLCFQTFLAVSEGENYYFIHKSFQEYYVAKYIFDRMKSREPSRDVAAIEEVLQTVLQFDVVTFLKEMLIATDVPPVDKECVVNNLIKVYQRNSENDLRSVTIRQHASHYLAQIGTRKAVLFLEKVCDEEANKWVQRGLMVGLALYCDKSDFLDKYIGIVHKDAEAASINIGYHLVYYGDQLMDSGYYDLGEEKCERTVSAIFRHLKSERHKNGWSLDILTLNALLESRGSSVRSARNWQPSFLKEFLNREDNKQNAIFQQEREHLKNLLEGEIEWN